MQLSSLSEEVLKFAPWSFSKHGTLQTCALQFYKKYVAREPEGRARSASRIGNVIHQVLEHGLADRALASEALLDDAAEDYTLTTDEAIDARSFLPNVDRYRDFVDRFCAQHAVTQKFVEFDAAIGTDFALIGYDDPRALIRGKIDQGMITSNNDLIIVDHKSGKKKPIDEHAVQLNVYRLFGAARFPHLRAVQCAIHHVADGTMVWDRPMTVDEINRRLRPWLVVYLNKHAPALRTMLAGDVPEAKTGWACEWCGFVDVCEAGKAESARRAGERDRKKKLKIVGDI